MLIDAWPHIVNCMILIEKNDMDLDKEKVTKLNNEIERQGYEKENSYLTIKSSRPRSKG